MVVGRSRQHLADGHEVLGLASLRREEGFGQLDLVHVSSLRAHIARCRTLRVFDNGGRSTAEDRGTHMNTVPEYHELFEGFDPSMSTDELAGDFATGINACGRIKGRGQ